MGALLNRRQRSIRRWQPWVIVEFVGFTGLAVALALGRAPAWGAFAGVFAALGVGVLLTGRRDARRIEKLQAELAQRQQHAA